MPLYEFKCSDCDYQFEEYTKKRNLMGVECPKCGGFAIKGLSTINFVVKGFNAKNGYSKKGKK